MAKILHIAHRDILPGQRAIIELEVPGLFSSTRMTVPVEIIRGVEDGPVLGVSAAVHGDEINGVEIAGRILHSPFINNLKGTLIIIPIMNIYGFNIKSRYLPDRRDLNRCFPGKRDGTVGSRLAYIVMNEIIKHCDYFIDLHTAGNQRTNLPQVRADLKNDKIANLAKSFSAPVIVQSDPRDSSLREAIMQKNIPVIVYEGGQALRIEENVVKQGVSGILNVMRELGMIHEFVREDIMNPLICLKTFWARAPRSGIFKVLKPLGSVVKAGEVLGIIADPFGNEIDKATSPYDAVIIGKNLVPQVMGGDALFHLGLFDDIEVAEEYLESIEQYI